jgi:hypothetical protein
VVADARTEAVTDGEDVGLPEADGDTVPVRLTEVVRVGDVVTGMDRDGGADRVARVELVGLVDGAEERDVTGLPVAVLEAVGDRDVDGLAVVVLDAEDVGVGDRVTAVEPVDLGLRVEDCVASGERVADADGVMERVGGEERVAVGLAVAVREPVDVRVGDAVGNGERVPVGDRLIVRVAVTVPEGRDVFDGLTEGNGDRLPVGVRVEVALTRAVFVSLGDLVGVQVGREVAEGKGSPTASARRLPSTPISVTGHGDPRTPPPSRPGENPVRHSKRRRNLILLWFIKHFLGGEGSIENPGRPKDSE